MSKKKYLIYSLINKLEVSEKTRFKDYLNFYFKKPKPYLEMLNIINKLNTKLEKDIDFPEEILVKKIDDSIIFTKLKFNFKAALHSFLRLLFLDDENNLLDENKTIRKFLDINVLSKFKEHKYSIENLESLSIELEKANNLEDLNALLPILTAYNLEMIIPIYGWNNINEKYNTLYCKFKSQMNDYNDFISSKYLKRSIFFSSSDEDIVENYKEIQKLNNRTLSFDAKIQSYLGIARYFLNINKPKKEVEIRKLVVDLIEKRERKNDFDFANALNAIKMIFYLQEETIAKEEGNYYLKIFKTYYKQLSSGYFSLYSISYNILILIHTILFEKNPHSIQKILSDLNLNIQKDYTREIDISHLISLENICLFLSNQIEESHTKSSDFNFEAKKNLKYFLLIRMLSAYLLFDVPFISSEYRKIRRLMDDNDEFIPIKKILKLLHKYKSNQLKNKLDLIIEIKNFISSDAKHLKRMDIIILDHFLSLLK